MDTDKIRAPIQSLLTWCIERSQPGERWPVLACEAVLAELDKPAPPVFLAVYIGTTNDTNGNPRRGWYVSRLDGAPMLASAPTDRKGETAPAYTCWVEEGYNGQSAAVEAVARVLGMPTRTWREVAAVRALIRETGRIDVTPGEYRSARDLPRFGGAE